MTPSSSSFTVRENDYFFHRNHKQVSYTDCIITNEILLLTLSSQQFLYK